MNVIVFILILLLYVLLVIIVEKRRRMIYISRRGLKQLLCQFDIGYSSKRHETM